MSHSTWIVKLVTFALSFTLLAVPTDATSIIVDFKADRIILLADSRAENVNPSGENTRDNVCKIVVLGRHAAFAETGHEGYTPSSPSDRVPAWQGTAEALSAYRATSNQTLLETTRRWAFQAARFFDIFYRYAPQRVRNLRYSSGSLLFGMFVGADGRKGLKFYAAQIVFDNKVPSRPVGYKIISLDPRREPYATNSITDELLKGVSVRAKQVKKVWTRRSWEIPPAERHLRWLEFVIHKTGAYDSSVGGPVNALSLTSSSVTWLENATCH